MLRLLHAAAGSVFIGWYSVLSMGQDEAIDEAGISAVG